MENTAAEIIPNAFLILNYENIFGFTIFLKNLSMLIYNHICQFKSFFLFYYLCKNILEKTLLLCKTSNLIGNIRIRQAKKFINQ